MQMVATKAWTLDELHRLPDDGNTYELIRGELFVTPAPTPDHEVIAVRLARLLDPYVAANGLGYVFRPRAVIEYDGSQAEPDLMVRQPPPPKSKWVEAPVPILVVEILSPTTRRRDREHKREFYPDAGVPEYWIVDPEARTITSARRGHSDVTDSDAIVWHPDGVEQPLTISIGDVFG